MRPVLLPVRHGVPVLPAGQAGQRDERRAAVSVHDELACQHPRREHRVWWWVEDGDPIPVPREAVFDNRADAMDAVIQALTDPPLHLRWVKVFRSDNESYTCFRWTNPEPWPQPEPLKVPVPASPRKRPWWGRK